MEIASSNTYRRVFVWEGPVRFFHWINVLSIVVLAGTGIIIANPPAIMSVSEASNSYWFGTTRFIHFLTAYIFLLSMLFRVYWSFVGNKYASYKVFFPYTKKGWANVMHVLKVDVLLGNAKEFNIKQIAIGHNAMAGLAYSGLFIMMIIQVFTGFGLYSDNAQWWLPKMFSWVVPLLGGDAAARLIHHTITWLIVLFTVIHIYLVMYHDWLEGRGEVSSMFGGFKFVRGERVKD